jgi:hypothetical protein
MSPPAKPAAPDAARTPNKNPTKLGAMKSCKLPSFKVKHTTIFALDSVLGFLYI